MRAAHRGRNHPSGHGGTVSLRGRDIVHQAILEGMLERHGKTSPAVTDIRSGQTLLAFVVSKQIHRFFVRDLVLRRPGKLPVEIDGLRDGRTEWLELFGRMTNGSACELARFRKWRRVFESIFFLTVRLDFLRFRQCLARPN